MSELVGFEQIARNDHDAQLLLQLTCGRKLGTTLNLRDVAFYLNQYIATEDSPKAKQVLEDYQQKISEYKVVGFQPFARSPESEKKLIYVKGQPLKTTIAQLRFLSWCINIGLLEHLNKILVHIKQQKRAFEADRKRKKRLSLQKTIDHDPADQTNQLTDVEEEESDLIIKFSFD